MELPQSYNDKNTYPIITFTPPVFNPLIDPVSGVLDLSKADEAFAEAWDQEKHFILTAMTYAKKIFYARAFEKTEAIANKEAKVL